ncbi:MAG: transporter substrate-binding domain-containing protein [Epsilonproteobacteria bacterium]|nr:transporter substrate-binding domain-containing protein [Campylobacterota bacterium]
MIGLVSRVFVVVFIVAILGNAKGLEPRLERFLLHHQTLTLGSCDAWIPYVVVNEDGSVSGYDVDVLNLVNHYTGAHFVLKAGNWAQMQKLAQEGYLDGLATLIKTPEREKWLLFSRPYIMVFKTLLTAEGNGIDPVASLEALKGRSVAVAGNNVLDRRLAQKAGLRIVPVRDPEEAYRKVLAKEIDFAFGNPSTEVVLARLGLPKLRTVYRFDQKVPLRFALRKELAEGMEILEKGLAMIPQSTFQKLEKKWFSGNYTYTGLKLTAEQEAYIRKKGALRFCKGGGAYPYGEMDEEGRFYGMMADVAEAIADTLGVKALFVKERCEISLGGSGLATAPWWRQSLVLVTKKERPYREDLRGFDGKVGVPDRMGVRKYLVDRYPKLRVVTYNDTRKALEDVAAGRIDGYVDLLGIAVSALEHNGMDDLKIGARLHVQVPLRFTVRDAQLLEPLNQAIAQLDDAKKRSMYHRWMSAGVREDHGGARWRKAMVLFALIGGLSLFWIVRLARAKRELERSRREVTRINEILQRQVEEEVRRSQEKDALLYEQSKFAQMGEMIGMIAHQWRQPLNNISLVASTLKVRSKKGRLDPPMIEEMAEKIIEYTRHLSRTIDDFRNFFKPEKRRERIGLNEVAASVCRLVELPFGHHGIHFEKSLMPCRESELYRSELEQVVLNLVKNAQDVLRERNVTNPRIEMRTFESDGHAVLEVRDNGGGVPEEILGKIFDPYFSTKKKNGTGLGLYMSKIIVEEHCGGTLTVRNTEEGACFRIEIPLVETARS